MFKLSARSVERMYGVDQRWQEIVERALSISKVDFGIPLHGGKRTAIEQHELFIKGVTKADGRYKKSNHQSGGALDVFAYVDGKADWDIRYMAQVAAAILQAANELGYSVVWGGHWKDFIDTPHFELKDE